MNQPLRQQSPALSSLVGDLRDLVEHDHKTARPLLADIVSRMPKSADARALLGMSYLRSLEPTKALTCYAEAHALEPNNPAHLLQMGLCAVCAGDYPHAVEFFNKSFHLKANPFALSVSALMLHRLGKLKDSVALFDRLLSTLKRDHPEAPHALRGMAMALRDGGAIVASDRFMHELVQIHRLNPSGVAASLIDRDNSIDFPGWTRYALKTDLGRSLNAYETRHPGVLAFPSTFVLPEDRAALATYANTHAGAAFIAKPHRGTGGQGIAVSRDVTEFENRDDVVVQRYIDRPYLVNNRKGHVRLYGLVTSLEPFRAYVYRDGVVRFAPDSYDNSDIGLENVHSHITNTAVHRGHPTLDVSTDPTKEDTGAVWSLSALLNRIKADGGDVDQLWINIRTLVSGFIDMLREDGLFDQQKKAGLGRSFPPKLFGLDVLIDADLKPWLIEAQRKPALGGAPLVQKVNGRMFQTIFAMKSVFALNDASSAAEIGRLSKDPGAVFALERQVETEKRGLFELLS